MWTYRLRYVRCGKASCKCAAGQPHGPYWYGYEHRGGKVSSKYFGKRPTSSFDYRAHQSEPRIDDRWLFRGRMDMRTALRIFALPYRPNQETLKARFRALIGEHHPDHGGTTEIAAAIIAAYRYLS